MFDIGFLELLVILIIALLVIGPERMPEVARKLGSFIGKTKRFIHSVKEDNEWQETVRELKQSMDLQEEQKRLQDLEKDLQTSLNPTQQEIDLDSFTRPSFGGSQPPVDSAVTSQYSKAPAQPMPPSKATDSTPKPNTSDNHTAASADLETPVASKAEPKQSTSEPNPVSDKPSTESKS
jgi:sec-independent protein translocase protein TatB